jgi:hypothetical protein
MVFPEMDAAAEMPEITEACLACTLLPYDELFELGPSLAAAASGAVPLNHPHCAKFCVLDGCACGRG